MRPLKMSVILSAICLTAAIHGSTTIVANAATPCEDILKQLRDAEAKAKLDDATRAKVEDLKTKGIERCNADDDKRADAFFEQALALIKQ